MSHFKYHISQMGDNAILIQVQEPPSELLLEWLLAKRDRLSEIFGVSVVHTYNELLVKVINPSQKVTAIKEEIKEILNIKEGSRIQIEKTHQVPVCYHKNYGVDLERYSVALNVSIEKIIEWHTKPTYTVYFLGFLPGFPYLEGLDNKLFLPRKSSPSRKISRGGVGIGGRQTGIYPQESPGGWHIIGQTPIKLFDVTQKNPSPFAAGDTLRFYEIGEEKFLHMKNQNKID